MAQQSCAGGKAHTLQPTVQNPQDTHEQDQGIGKLRSILYARDPTCDVLPETEGEVGQRTEGQANCHEETGIDSIGQYAIEET